MSDKWNKIYSQQVGPDPEPCWTLQQHAYVLPHAGDALDLACGRGGNARFLAARGLAVTAWDLSDVAVAEINAVAADRAWPLVAECRDVEQNPPPDNSYDVIVVSNFLHRATLPQLVDALRDGGVLIYQTHTLARPEGMSGPSNPDFLLRPNELLEVFNGLTLVAYREDGLLGDLTQGRRGVASLVAMK